MSHFTFFNVFSKRELTFTFAICCRPSVCRLSVTFVRPSRLKFSAIFLRHLVPWPYVNWYPHKILRRSFQGNPTVGGLNARGIAKYSDFGPIEGYISETVQDIGGKLVINGKSHMSFRLVSNSATLNDLERRNSPYFALFHRIRGALRKSMCTMSS